MTSGNFTILPLSQIVVDRDRRQRKELPNIEALAQSIAKHGLMHPIVVTRENKLVAGERRYAAHQLLGFDNIQVHYTDELDPVHLHELELEENVRRVDLDWQDRVAAVAEYHKLKAAQEEEWSQDDTAEALNISQAHLSRMMLVQSAIEEGIEEVKSAPKLSTAANFAARRQERKKTSARRDLLLDLSGPAEPSSESTVTDGPAETSADYHIPRAVDVLQADFVTWSEEIQDEPFNLLHVDFPYGVEAGNTNSGQSAAKAFGGYDDDPDTYRKLLRAFTTNLDRFCAPSAHLVFWFSMDFYQETLDTLREAGWRIDPFPLIWYKSDNTGILPDANRGPRRVYETAFFGSRGDRKIVKAVGNAVGAGTPGKGEKIHMSHKSGPMLEHFLRMLVDEYSRVLDPTCGSAQAIEVAEKLGAEFSLGLEINPDYVADAREKLGLP